MRDERHFRSSVHREKVVEHLFVGELLRFLWNSKLHTVQVLWPEVDASGYDIVVAHSTFTRYVQLKASVAGGSTRVQKVNGALADLKGGCIIWIVVGEDLSLQKFLWYGGKPEASLEQLRNFNPAKKTHRNAAGVKDSRRDTYTVPLREFAEVSSMGNLVAHLMGNELDL